MEPDIRTIPPSRKKLSLIHWGSFSGTVKMIEDSFRSLVNVEYHDLGRMTRQPDLLPARALAQIRSLGTEWPWYKSTTWSKAIQGRALRSGWIDREQPTLFFQTLAAPVLDVAFPYAIYTDRVAKEGAQGSEAFRSTWGPGWMEREERFLRGASAVFVMGPSTKIALADMYGVEPSRVHVVGAGPGSRVGPISTHSRKPRQILFVGTDWNLKGGPQILEAFTHLRRSRPDIQLVLAGSGPTGDVPIGVKAMGRVSRDRMPNLFEEADLFVVPTFMEALGYSLLESLMHGLPSIGSTVGNQEWLIGEAGLTVPPGNVAAIEAGIERVLDDYDRYKSAAVERAEHLRQTMTWDNVASSIVEHLYRGR